MAENPGIIRKIKAEEDKNKKEKQNQKHIHG